MLPTALKTFTLQYKHTFIGSNGFLESALEFLPLSKEMRLFLTDVSLDVCVCVCLCWSRFMPFVLRYADAQGVNVCIDSSISGNDARYVRCSCMPNAKVTLFLCHLPRIKETAQRFP